MTEIAVVLGRPETLLVLSPQAVKDFEALMLAPDALRWVKEGNTGYALGREWDFRDGKLYGLRRDA